MIQPITPRQPAFRRTLTDFMGDEAGGNAIEYSLIASAIGAAVLVTVVSIGDYVVGIFNAVAVAAAFH